jgi:hypothetical protein
MIYPLYTDVELLNDDLVTQTDQNGTTTPYTGPATLWIKSPDGAIASHTIQVTAGAWSFTVYANQPLKWRYTVRIVGTPHGSMFDSSFDVGKSAFPETGTAPELPMYWGVASSIPTVEADVLALANTEVRANYLRRISIAATSQRLIIAYPAPWGTANVRFVSGGFGIAMVWATIMVAGILCNAGYSFDSNMTFGLQDLEIY